jgi:hypothetical protein
MLVIASDIDIVSGSLDLQQVGTHIQTLASTCQETLILFTLQLLLIGWMKGISVRLHEMFHGIFSPCLSSFSGRQ